MKRPKSARISKYVDRVIGLHIDMERIVGCVTVVVVYGETVYHRAAGFADREMRTRMREDDIFRIASCTKTIVAATAMRMAEEGLLSLDDAVDRWLPEFRPRFDGVSETITLQQLMSHTSGLSYGFRHEETAYRAARVSTGLDQPGLSMGEELERLASIPLLFKPGTAYRYSLGLDVLGAVMERAAGAKLDDLVRRKVTGPLGLADTAFEVADSTRLVTPYADGRPRPVRMTEGHIVPTLTGMACYSSQRLFDRNSFLSGGAGMTSTAGEYAAFLEALRKGGAPILRSASVDALFEKALPRSVTYEEPGWTFGLGAAVLENASLDRSPHAAGTYKWGGAYGQTWFVDPARRLTFVCFTNTAIEGVDGAFAQSVRDAVYYGLTAGDGGA